MNHESIIWNYIRSNHVLSITSFHNGDVWAANLFYACDYEQKRLLFMTSEINTKHGALMLANSHVVGTICDQTVDVAQLKGLQYTAVATIVHAPEALDVYMQQFPMAKHHQETLWMITFTALKLTDNSAGFGTKYTWNIE
ncbi:MAG: hypothetical protein H6Q26_2396 [Bacteroidetes bacterium]|nr:hypothetical protein [Bacteroidota bacterium]